MLEHLADALGDLLWRLDLQRTDVDDADRDRLVLRELGEEGGISHLAAREVEDEFVHLHVEVLGQDPLVPLRGHPAHSIAPYVAEAEMP